MKYRILALWLCSFFFLSQACQAVDTVGIDKVRGKAVLDSTDSKVIDDFWSQGVNELVNTGDFSTISKLRTTLLSKKGSDLPSNQGQYAAYTSESVNKHIAAALKNCDTISPADMAFKVKLNLLILIDGLEDLKLSENVFGLLNDKNAAIRYWAVHCLSNDGFISKLNADMAANAALAKRISTEFEKTLQTAEPAILVMMGRFGAKINAKEGQELLIKIAKERMKRYETGQGGNELVDSEILKLLSGRIQKEGVSAEDKAVLGREFAQLFSYVMQKYMSSSVTPEQKNQLGSVMAETEKSCIGVLLGVEQLKIRRAISQNDMTMLTAEHDRLLGSDAKAGELGSKLGFNYGKAADGSDKLAPAKLSK